MDLIRELEAVGAVLPPAARAILARFEERMRELEIQLAAATARIRDLEARLGTNSSNSSLPPSRDPPGAVRPKKKPTGRKRGGQVGHQGVWREPVPAGRVDEVVVHRPEQCRHCGGSLAGALEAGPAVCHQVMEIPKLRAHLRISAESAHLFRRKLTRRFARI